MSETSLVPYNSWKDVLGSVYSKDSEVVFSFHFRNGLDRLTIDSSGLDEHRKELERWQERDQKRHDDSLTKGKQQFDETHSWLQRRFGRVRYVPPEPELSLETSVYQRLVEVGDTLAEYIANLKNFSSQFTAVGKEHERLFQEEGKLQSEMEQLERRSGKYEEEGKAMITFLEQLENYSGLETEVRDELVEAIKERTGGVDVSCGEVRESLLHRVKEGLFILAQTKKGDEADYEVADIQLDSVSRQIAALTRDAERLWELYNPARVEAAQLKAVYEELSSDAERGCMLHNVSQVLLSAGELCERARERQEALETEIEGNMEVLRSFKELNEGRGCYQLSAGKEEE